NDLAGIYENLKTKIEDATRARTSSKAKQKLTETYDQEIDDYYDRYIKIIDKAQKELNRRSKNGYAEFSEFEKAGFWKFITGSMHMGDLESTPGLERVVNLLNNATIDASADLKTLRSEMVATTKQYNKSLKEIKEAYGETEEVGGSAPVIPLLGDDAAEKAKRATLSQIKSIQKLQDAYEKLLPYLDDVQLKATLKKLFPNIGEGIIDSLDFTAELERLADELERFDEEAAQNLRDTISKDVAGSIADSFKAVEEYRKSLDKWLSEDFDLSGKGIAFDISKIISNLNDEYAKIDQKRLKNLQLLTAAQMGDEEALKKVRETYGEEFWQIYITQGKSAIENLAYAERIEAKKTADEKIRDLASKYVSEKIAEKNIDTTNLEDKTIAQVQTQIDRLNALVIEANKAKGDILADIMNGKISDGQMATFEMLSKVVEILQIKIEDAGETVEQKLYDKFLKTMDAVGNLGKEIETLGKNLEFPGLEKIGREISRTTEEVASLMKAFEAKDTIAIVANFITMFVTRLSETLTYAYQQQMALNDATKAYAESQNEIRRNAYTNAFGTDELGLARENLEILNEAQERYNETLNKFKEIRFQSSDARQNHFQKTSLESVMEGISKEQGWDLYRANGELNIEAIEAYYEAFADRLTRRQRKFVQGLIEDGNSVEDALARQAEFISNIFNQTADNVADAFITAFKESGEAALDYGEIVDGIATDIARSVIKATLMQSVFSEDLVQNAANKLLTGDAAGAMAMIEEAMQSAQALAPYFQELLTSLKPYLQMEEEPITNTVGDGIKGMTEDTANLLASYINAMRSDVSQMRTLQATHLPIISAAMPTIMDHLAQINAHTYDTSQHTQQMLTELISLNGKIGDVISEGSNGSAIKVLM
ncbi:MAG: hypothetical protein J6U51_05650, partial [Bacteroidales bacterium]|nr:hypothetical protein [Bacteroidales bacterium]